MTLYLSAVNAADQAFSGVRNWSDQSAVHRAVMSLFPDDLGGAASRVRAGAGILYRVETRHGHTRVLVQSRVAPLGHAVRDLGEYLERLSVGDIVMLRSTANTVTCEARTGKRRPVTGDAALVAWFAKRLTGITLIQTQDMLSQRSHISRDGRTIPLACTTIDAVGRVVDTASLVRTVEHGIGRARAFGCGMVSVAPVRRHRELVEGST